MFKNKKFNIKEFLSENAVPVVFLTLSIIFVYYSGTQPAIIMNDVVARFARNAFFVLSLLFPVLAGMGLNFGIVVGAMAAQIGIYTALALELSGLPAVLLATVVCIPFALLFGFLSGWLNNKTKGQEMLTSMFVGYFAHGVYMLLFLFIIGGIIPINVYELVLPSGVGARSSLDLTQIKGALDSIVKVDLFTFVFILAALSAVITVANTIKNKKLDVTKTVLTVALVVVGVAGNTLPALSMFKRVVKVPVVTYALIGILCAFISMFFKTKLGQDMRAVGMNMEIAEVSGINVNKTRITANMISVVLSAFGQIMFLQNLGTLSTYTAHQNVGMFAGAALLIGGASVTKATVPQALLGTFLFHLLFNVSPLAGQNIFGSALIGEYFRVFIVYGVIALAIVLHAAKKASGKK
ncbi:MAG: ABC transporter permease [Oscillospiraceae bacterium]|nr:ABC transporter permease [Oscillospiraceae bacterium]